MTLPPSVPLLEAIWGSSATDIYVVGAAGTIIHYDGATWTSMMTPTKTADLKSVFGIGADVFVVGTGAAIWKLNN